MQCQPRYPHVSNAIPKWLIPTLQLAQHTQGYFLGRAGTENGRKNNMKSANGPDKGQG